MAGPETDFPKIAVVGAGTGPFTLLNSLKHHTPRIHALVNMVDDGGSTGELRDELGVLPPGDIRQSLVALSPSEVLREVFSHRFSGREIDETVDTEHLSPRTLKGHTIGNILISGIADMTNDFSSAVTIAGQILNITGEVIPITLDNCRLVLTLPDKSVIHGEHNVDELEEPNLKGSIIGFDYEANLNPKAEEVIYTSDMVVIAPGDLYTSTGPTLAVKGIARALRETEAKVVYICNLVNKNKHTVGFSVKDYVDELNRIIGKPFLDYLFYNVEAPSEEALKRYEADGDYPVSFDMDYLDRQSFKAVPGNFLSKVPIARREHDKIKNRSLIRHDGEVIASYLMRTIVKR
jgi:uncharacterized cofD-like protein